MENTATENRASTAMRRLIAHPVGPTVVAVVLAMVSWPFVALELNAVQETFTSLSPPQIAPTDPARWTAALGAVLVSALVAGSVGGWLSRRGHNEFWALPLAWLVAVAASPVLPGLLGQNIGFGPICIDACEVDIGASDPASGIAAAILSPIAAMVEVGPLGILVIGFGIWWLVVRHFRPEPVRRPKVLPYPAYRPYQQLPAYAAPQPWPTAPYPSAPPAQPSGQQQLPQPPRSDGETGGAHRE